MEAVPLLDKIVIDDQSTRNLSDSETAVSLTILDESVSLWDDTLADGRGITESL